MAIVDLYSTRQRKAAKAGEAEVYVYDALPAPLRVQLQQIFTEAMGCWSELDSWDQPISTNNNGIWNALQKILCREKGLRLLAGGDNAYDDVMNYLNHVSNVESALDVVELCCRATANMEKLGDFERERRGIVQLSKAAIDEVNHRFRQAAVGYQFESGELMRVDSMLVHEEVVKPALSLLSDPQFAGAQQEFLKAHTFYRDGSYKDAIHWANKAFESTMKAACEKKGWPVPSGARASDLAKILKREGLWPSYLDNALDQLIASLASGLPQLRNHEGGHGDGASPKVIPGYLAAYALHLAASNIVLICNAAA